MLFFAILIALTTATLPILHLRSIAGRYFDLPVQIGSPPQQMHLRLDVNQGDMWLPNAQYFTACQESSTTLTVTGVSTSLETLAAVTNVSGSAVIADASSTKSTVVPTQAVNACASWGIYTDYDSYYSAFIDIWSRTIVGFADATSYMQTFLSSISMSGTWMTDSINVLIQFNSSLEDIRFWDVPFVLANSSNVGVGALALGHSQALDSLDSNFISNFVINDVVQTNSYSLALAASNSTDPLLVIGGLIGDLISSEGLSLQDFVPIYNEQEEFTLGLGLSNSVPAFSIYGWGVTASSSGESVVFSSSYNDRLNIANYPKPAILDTRHTYNYIPYSTLVELAVELNAYYSSDLNIWITDCAIGKLGTIDMYLAGNFTVKMPISNFIFPIIINDTNLVFQGGNAACALTFLPDYRLGYSLMGSSLIKSVYLAVDNDNKQLAIGNMKNLLSEKNVNVTITPVTTVKKDIFIGEGNPSSQISILESSSGTLVTVDGVVTTDYGFPFTESYAKPDGSNVVTKTVNGTTITSTNSGTWMMVTAMSTLSTSSGIFSRFPSTTSYSDVQAINNGTIPYAVKHSGHSGQTLTIPSTITFTDSLAVSSDVAISAGEVVLETGAMNQGFDKSKTSNTSKLDTTIYAFSSLVTSIGSPIGAAVNIQPVSMLSWIWWILGLITLL